MGYAKLATMKKEEFLRQLKEALSGFPADSAEETAEYYREIIEDSMLTNPSRS